MATCNICKYAGTPSYKPPCSECKGFSKYEYEKPNTNADRIRAMSDEELATHLHDIGWDCHLCAEHRRLDNEPLLSDQMCDEKCVEHCLEWLKQPAEEEAQQDCPYNKNGHCIGQKLMPECDAKNCDRRK